jgi:hypothetical protein
MKELRRGLGGCCSHGSEQPRSRWARRTVRGVLFAALAALMPKCPICIAAWLGALGLSGLAARVDPCALWLAGAAVLALAVAPLVHRLLGSALRTVRGYGGN